MKTLLLTLFVALMLGISCSSSSGKVSGNELKQDTVVRSVRDRSGEYCEFFVVTKQDTSAYSCIFSSNDMYDRLSMSIYFDRTSKFCLDINAITADNDTTAFATGGVVDENDKNYVPTYTQWLREMELCLKSASKVYDLSKLCVIRAFSSDLSDATVLATNNLVDNFKPWQDGYYSHFDIAKSIEMTPLIGDLNKILDEYGLEVEDVSCEGVFVYIDPDKFIKKFNMSKTLKTAYDIIDIPVKFHLKKQDEGHANKTAPSEQRR
jgi:hypothetical protein